MISVIVPVFNSGEYLDRCVGSILNQDFSPIEILIVDDGSTDPSTIEKCDELCRTNTNVSVYHIKNCGSAAARNFGIQKAKGDYIGFVDSDDVIEPDMYSSLYGDIKAYGVKVALGGITIMDNGRMIDKLPPLKTGLYRQPDLMHYFFLGHWHSACTNLYSKSLFDKVSFPEGEINEDYVLNYLVFRDQEAISFNSNRYYHYLRREGSNTSSAVSLRFVDWLKHTARVYDDYKDDPELKEAAKYQDLFSNITLGNVCLLTLAKEKSHAASDIYRLVTKNIRADRDQVAHNRFLSKRHRLYGLLMADCPGLYKSVVIFYRRLEMGLGR